MKPSTRVFLLLAGLILAFLVLGLLGHDSRSRRALRDYQAKLRTSGEKLTYQELVGSRAGNVASLAALTNAVAQLRVGQLQPPTLEPRQIVRPGYARAVWMEPAPAPNLRSGGTTLTWAIFAAEMETNRMALEEIREALRVPAPYSGSRTGILHGSISGFIALRSAAQWLSRAELIALHQGQRLEALENLGALVSLARVNREEYTLVGDIGHEITPRVDEAVTAIYSA